MNTLPKEVELILNEYFTVFNIDLPDLMESFYLTGSIVLNDFHEGKSDVDFVAVINREMNSKDLSNLKKIHKGIRSKYRKIVLEGSYITPQQIGKSDKDVGPAIYFDGKKIRHDHKSGNASIITWVMLKKYGMTLIGKKPEHYIPNIDINDLVTYVKLNVNSYWVNWTERAAKTLSKQGIFTLSPQGVEWGVLGISRLYYTMHEGDVTSKYQAGEYVLERIPIKFENIVKEALRIRKDEGKKGYYKSPFRRRKDMLLFMEYMISQF